MWRIWWAPNNASRCQTGFNSAFKGLMKLEFSPQIFDKIPKYQISWKSVQRDTSCCMRTVGWRDGHTDTTKLTVAFRNFANALKNHTKKWSSTPKTRVHTHTHTHTHTRLLQLNSVPIVGSDEAKLRSIGTRSIDIQLSSFHWYVLEHDVCPTLNQAYGWHFSCDAAAEIHNWTPISTIGIWRSGISWAWFATDYLTITGQSINEQPHS